MTLLFHCLIHFFFQKLLRRQKQLKRLPREELMPLLEIHLKALDEILRPGLNILTWSSLNLEGFIRSYDKQVSHVESLFLR